MASKQEPTQKVDQVDKKGQQKRTSIRLLLCAVFSLAALTAAACATEGPGVGGQALDTATVARNIAREVQQSIAIVESRIDQTQEQLAELATAMANLASAIAADDQSGIAAATEEIGDIGDTASQAVEDANTLQGTDEPQAP